LTHRVKHRPSRRIVAPAPRALLDLPARLCVMAATRAKTSTVFLAAAYRVKKGF